MIVLIIEELMMHIIACVNCGKLSDRKFGHVGNAFFHQFTHTLIHSPKTRPNPIYKGPSEMSLSVCPHPVDNSRGPEKSFSAEGKNRGKRCGQDV